MLTSDLELLYLIVACVAAEHSFIKFAFINNSFCIWWGEGGVRKIGSLKWSRGGFMQIYRVAQ